MIRGRVIIVVPAYNEADKIKHTIEGLKRINLIDEILVINDGSTDNTAEVAKKLGVSVISLNSNHGKGYAMRKAIKETDCDYIGFVDGDVGLTSMEVEKLLTPVLLNEVDFTIAKFPNSANKTNVKGGFGFVKRLAKSGVNFYTGEEIDTSLSGQRIYKRDVIDTMKYIPTHYGIEVAMTIQALKNGFTFKEIPVDMVHRYSDRSLKGFKHRGKQFFDILKTLFIMYFRR